MKSTYPYWHIYTPLHTSGGLAHNGLARCCPVREQIAQVSKILGNHCARRDVQYECYDGKAELNQYKCTGAVDEHGVNSQCYSEICIDLHRYVYFSTVRTMTRIKLKRLKAILANRHHDNGISYQYNT